MSIHVRIAPRPSAPFSAAGFRPERGRVTLFGLVAVLVVIGLLVLAGAWLVGVPGTAPPRPRIKHVILLTIDTLRADSLPFHGNPRVRAPSLTELARQSVLFEQALSTSPWTRPSLISILTGLSPSVHGVTIESLDVEALLPESIRTLAERMRDAGYRTATIGYNPFISTSPNLRRGFDEFWFFPHPDESSGASAEPAAGAAESPARTIGGYDAAEINRRINSENATEILTDLARQWLTEHATETTFLWLHYFDPHGPYTPPREQYVAVSGDETTERQAYADWRTAVNQGLAEYLLLERMALAGAPLGKDAEKRSVLKEALRERRDAVHALYEGEVEHVDRAVGRVVDCLKRLGIHDEALIVVTSDHGEEFFEHGGLEHGHALYQELIHVPLLVKLPGTHEGRRVRARVSNRSVFPTLLELCTGESPGVGVDIPSLVHFWDSTVAAETPPYLLADSILYGDPGAAVLFGDRKYVRRPRSGAEELYDLAADPGETVSLAESDPAGCREGRRHLMDANHRAAELQRQVWIGGVRTTERSEESRRLLRSHGYLK